jgi:hypothetical protein
MNIVEAFSRINELCQNLKLFLSSNNPLYYVYENLCEGKKD